MGFLAVVLIMIFIIAMILFTTSGYSMDADTALPIATVITTIVLIGIFIYSRFKNIVLPRKRKAIKGFYEIQLKASPAAKAFCNEALLMIKDKYPDPAHRTIANCAAILELPMLDEKSVFYHYYQDLYDNVEGLAILYAQKKSWLTGELYNYCDREIVSKYDNLSLNDEAMLTQFPWLISLGLNK